MKNLKIFSKSDEFKKTLESFGVVKRGRFEYKKITDNGKRMQGEYFIKYRLLTTEQELKLVPYYHEAIEEFFGEKVKEMIIVGVAYGSLSLPKTVQILGYDKFGMEYVFAEKRNGKLGLFDEQADKCKGKHILFIEDVCNNATSAKELAEAVNKLEIRGYSILYGTHRGHTFLEEPKNEIYTMSLVNAPSYHPDEIPENLKRIPLIKYKK